MIGDLLNVLHGEMTSRRKIPSKSPPFMVPALWMVTQRREGVMVNFLMELALSPYASYGWKKPISGSEPDRNLSYKGQNYD
jgi:hypothetical protein